LPVLGAAGGKSGVVVQPATIAHKPKAQQANFARDLCPRLFRGSSCFDARRWAICVRLTRQMIREAL